MEFIMVTVTNEKSSFFVDLEVPADLTLDKLKEDIVQTLNGYLPELCLDTFSTGILSNRAGRLLKPEETLEEAGVWSGDYLTLTYL